MIQEINSSFVVMPKEEVEGFASINSDVMAMAESRKYPAVQIIAVDFLNKEEQ